MWDLWNDPDLADSETMFLLKELSNYLREIDPTHPITIGGGIMGQSASGNTLLMEN
jgi:hypothetical protein